jgi:hypothetical protein
LRITRYPSISSQQFLGCVSAFADSLTGELNSAMISLRRLAGGNKGSAFAYEMTLDNHRYGVLIVLDRWRTVCGAYGPHLAEPIAQSALDRIGAAERILEQANRLIDGSPAYSDAMIEACQAAFQSVNGIFRDELESAAQNAKLGPMLSDDYTSARRIFLEDLAVR